jgi:hypothetical protein
LEGDAEVPVEQATVEEFHGIPVPNTVVGQVDIDDEGNPEEGAKD